MKDVLSYVFCAIGSAMAGLWLYLVFKTRYAYPDLLKAVDSELYPNRFLLKPGFMPAGLLGEKTLGWIENLSGIGGIRPMDQFTSFCTLAYGTALLIPLCSMGFLISGMTGEVLYLIFFVVVGCVLSVYPVYRYREKQKNQLAECEQELPCAISKMVLLCEAGLSVIDAFSGVACSGQGYLYMVMKTADEMIKNGKTVEEAMSFLTDNCREKDVKHFASVISRQNAKGGEGIIEALRRLNTESWQNRLSRASVRGQAASEALLIPMFMVFIGIIILIAVPLLAGLNV